MSTTTPRPVFTDTELPSEEPTSPFRPSGLVSLFFGVISAAALASVTLLIIPAVGVLFGLFAVRPTKDPSLKPGGRAFAVLGIGLSIFFAGWSWSYFQAEKSFLVNDGKQFALDWLSTLRHGQVEFAFELTQAKPARQLDTMPLSQYYTPENEMAFEKFESFTTGPSVKAIMQAEKDPDWQLVSVVDHFTRYQAEHVSLAFEDKSGALGPVLVVLCCSPALDSSGKPDPSKPYEWHVSDFAPYSGG